MQVRTGTASSGEVDIHYEDMGDPADPAVLLITRNFVHGVETGQHKFNATRPYRIAPGRIDFERFFPDRRHPGQSLGVHA